VQGDAGLRLGEADAEHPLDQPQPLVEGWPREVRTLGRDGLVATRLQVSRQVGQQARAVGRVIFDQWAQLPVRERPQPGVVAQQVQQPAQPQVGQSVEGPAVRTPQRRVRDLARVQQRPPRLAQRRRRRAHPHDRPGTARPAIYLSPNGHP